MLASDGSGTTTPFELAAGTVIIDRSSGATLSINTSANSTSTSKSTVTVTVGSSSDGDHVTAVGAGVGVSLGVLLVAALIGCSILYNQLRKAKRQLHGNGVMMHDSQRYDSPNNNYANPTFSPANGSQSAYSDGVTKTYSPGAHQPSPPPAQTSHNFMVEAPTDREVAMADSRPVGKP